MEHQKRIPSLGIAAQQRSSTGVLTAVAESRCISSAVPRKEILESIFGSVFPKCIPSVFQMSGVFQMYSTLFLGKSVFQVYFTSFPGKSVFQVYSKCIAG